jgi:hypothetical protein
VGMSEEIQHLSSNQLTKDEEVLLFSFEIMRKAFILYMICNRLEMLWRKYEVHPEYISNELLSVYVPDSLYKITRIQLTMKNKPKAVTNDTQFRAEKDSF